MLEYARWKYILVAVGPGWWRCCSRCRTCSATTARCRSRARIAAPSTARSSRPSRRRLKDAGVDLHAASSSTAATSWCVSPTTTAQLKGARHRQGREDRPDQGLRQRDDVRLARAALDAGAGPARHAAGPRPARRPLSAVRSGRRRRGRAAARHLRAGFPARAARREDPVHRHQHADRRFGRSQWPARAAARGRGSRRGARRAQEGAARPRVPRRQRRRRRRGRLRDDARSRCASAATSPSPPTSPRCAIA